MHAHAKKTRIYENKVFYQGQKVKVIAVTNMK